MVQRTHNVAPVSYTHLDVYKRQLLCRILLCRVAGGFQLFDVNGDTQRWIRFLPDFRVCPYLFAHVRLHIPRSLFYVLFVQYVNDRFNPL